MLTARHLARVVDPGKRERLLAAQHDRDKVDPASTGQQGTDDKDMLAEDAVQPPPSAQPAQAAHPGSNSAVPILEIQRDLEMMIPSAQRNSSVIRLSRQLANLPVFSPVEAVQSCLAGRAGPSAQNDSEAHGVAETPAQDDLVQINSNVTRRATNVPKSQQMFHDLVKLESRPLDSKSPAVRASAASASQRSAAASGSAMFARARKRVDPAWKKAQESYKPPVLYVLARAR